MAARRRDTRGAVSLTALPEPWLTSRPPAPVDRIHPWRRRSRPALPLRRPRRGVRTPEGFCGVRTTWCRPPAPRRTHLQHLLRPLCLAAFRVTLPGACATTWYRSTPAMPARCCAGAWCAPRRLVRTDTRALVLCALLGGWCEPTRARSYCVLPCAARAVSGPGYVVRDGRAGACTPACSFAVADGVGACICMSAAPLPILPPALPFPHLPPCAEAGWGRYHPAARHEQAKHPPAAATDCRQLPYTTVCRGMLQKLRTESGRRRCGRGRRLSQ